VPHSPLSAARHPATAPRARLATTRALRTTALAHHPTGTAPGVVGNAAPASAPARSGGAVARVVAGATTRAAAVAASTAAAAVIAGLLAAPATPAPAIPQAAPVAPATTPATAVAAAMFDRATAAAAPAALPTVTASVMPVAVRAPAAAGRSVAMRNALSKLGARYRWGATGPNAFDCSGLVYWSYRQEGVTLPRSSRAMSSVGTSVAKGNLQPGDLVFFYRPVSHVAIYIGNGQVVHASTAGSPVKISSLGTMPFTTARRV
jgi:cell wall-associated NlpC family hydrolase